MFSHGFSNVTKEDLLNVVTESDILHRYFNIRKLPVLINSPLRKDINPSFSIFKFGNKILFKDFATKEKGDIFTLLSCLWRTTFHETIGRIYNDVLESHTYTIKTNKTLHVKYQQSQSIIQCKTRNWKQYDLDYWASYGVPLKWLKYAEIYPISHKIIIVDNKKYIFGADKYAYAFVEKKEGQITLKIYQPFNKKGFKWANKHDKSVISLWTKIPKNGERLVICSSVKDALCLSANTEIPAIAVQGEGYSISNTAKKELKKRYKKVYVLFDNDPPGITDGEKFSKETGFINLVLPEFKGGKDISDMYKCLGKEKFLTIINGLFK